MMRIFFWRDDNAETIRWSGVDTWEKRKKGTFLLDVLDLDIEKVLELVNEYFKQFSLKLAFADDGEQLLRLTNMAINETIRWEKNGFNREPAISNSEYKRFREKLIEFSCYFNILSDDCTSESVMVTRVCQVVCSIFDVQKKVKTYMMASLSDPIIASHDFFNYLCESNYFIISRPIENGTEASRQLKPDSPLDEYKRIYLHDDREEFHISAYIAHNYFDACCTSLKELFLAGYKIKICENCGKLFIPYNRSDTLYCERQSPQDDGLSCKEYGTKKLWYDKIKENETANLCRKIYSAKQMLVKRNPDIEEYAHSFEMFKVESKRWKAAVKAGTKTEAEFLEWLKAVKEKKVP